MAELKAFPPQQVGGHFLFRNRPDVWREVAPHVRVRNCAKDSTILHHGDRALSFCLVARGWVKLARQTPDGKETIIGLCSEGDFFGEAALFPQANYPYNVDAIENDTEIIVIPSEVVRGIIRKDAAFSAVVMEMLNARVSQTQLKLEHMSTMSTAQRLGCFFLQQANRHTGSEITLQIPVEKCLLASYLGMKPETLSRSQAQLRSAGVSVTGCQVTISNVAQLREFVCNSCSEFGACESELG